MVMLLLVIGYNYFLSLILVVLNLICWLEFICIRVIIICEKLDFFNWVSFVVRFSFYDLLYFSFFLWLDVGMWVKVLKNFMQLMLELLVFGQNRNVLILVFLVQLILMLLILRIFCLLLVGVSLCIWNVNGVVKRMFLDFFRSGLDLINVGMLLFVRVEYCVVFIFCLFMFILLMFVVDILLVFGFIQGFGIFW